MLTEILTIILPIATGAAGWLAGGKKRNNDFIHELQQTINMLIEENSKLLTEQIAIKKQNVQLLCEMEGFRLENKKLLKEVEKQRIENIELRKEITELSEKVGHLKMRHK